MSKLIQKSFIVVTFLSTAFSGFATPVLAHTGMISQPNAGENVSGMVQLSASYDDDNEDDETAVQWAVRQGTCEAGTNTVFGNVDGKTDSFTWNGMNFNAMIDTSSSAPGEYCFIFNPSDSEEDHDVRETLNFFINEDEEDEEVCTDENLTVVSDDSNTNATSSFAHSAWTADISEATWIWSDPIAQNTETDTSETFEKSFNVNGSSTEAILDIASDNTYLVSLNGDEVASSSEEDNFRTETQDQYDLSEMIQEGSNTLSIEVTNVGVEGSDGESNPAGLLYKLSVDFQECEEDDDEDENGDEEDESSRDRHRRLHQRMNNARRDFNEDQREDRDNFKERLNNRKESEKDRIQEELEECLDEAEDREDRRDCREDAREEREDLKEDLQDAREDFIEEQQDKKEDFLEDLQDAHEDFHDDEED